MPSQFRQSSLRFLYILPLFQIFQDVYHIYYSIFDLLFICHQSINIAIIIDFQTQTHQPSGSSNLKHPTIFLINLSSISLILRILPLFIAIEVLFYSFVAIKPILNDICIFSYVFRGTNHSLNRFSYLSDIFKRISSLQNCSTSSQTQPLYILYFVLPVLELLLHAFTKSYCLFPFYFY